MAIPPKLVTKEGLVRNNQFIGTALGGYTPDGTASSEGVALLMRGVLQSYKVDQDPAKLAYAKKLFDGACKYFFGKKGVANYPTANSAQKWYHSWLVNVGPVFNVRGPIDPIDPIAGAGYIGSYNTESRVLFTNGVGTLTPPPAIVYQVVTDGTQFVWRNVFSDIIPGTGSAVTVDNYIDVDRNIVKGTQKGGSFGQPITAFDYTAANWPAAGTITLTDTTKNGYFYVNYCTNISGNQVAYGELYEGWPMWRHMGTNEFTTAGDALHWFTDVIRMFKEIEPSSMFTNELGVQVTVNWQDAHNRILDAWIECCNQESSSTLLFKGGATGPYSSFPLSYAYFYGKDSLYGTTFWQKTPPTGYNPVRTPDGYVTFTLPLEDGKTTGVNLRYGASFECISLYLDYIATSSISFDIKTSKATTLLYEYASAAGDKYRFINLHSANQSTPSVIPIASFSKFTGSTWTPDRGSICWGETTDTNGNVTNGASIGTHIPMMSTNANGPTMVQLVTLPNAYNGWMIVPSNVYDKNTVSTFAEWSNPPVISYKTNATDISFGIQDSVGWTWLYKGTQVAGVYDNCLPAHATLTSLVTQWSDFVAGTQKPTGWPTGKPAPTRPDTGLITGLQLMAQTDGTVFDIEYIAANVPVKATVGDISQVTLTYSDTKAVVWKVGDVNLVGGSRRTIQYFGALPFGYQVNGPRANSLGVTPYRGPIIAGYQCGSPWIDLMTSQSDIYNTKLSGMLDFMLQSQLEFQKRRQTNGHVDGTGAGDILGPWMHIYLPATWDCAQNGTIDTWVWDGPDGNPSWNGWQYRAFDAMSHTWYNASKKTSVVSPANIAKSTTICSRFIDWMYSWLQVNPTANGVPNDWRPGTWTQGIPFATTSYLDPKWTEKDSHAAALTLKGAVYSALAGADLVKCKYIIKRCLTALTSMQYVAVNDLMSGAFTNDAAKYDVYGFAQGEVMDGISLAMQNPTLIDLGVVVNNIAAISVGTAQIVTTP
jgi:hypothetical protein